ncbi:MAG TPA: SGNH/GDSL hydrolase family protein, partial [Thermopolyspora sp.]
MKAGKMLAGAGVVALGAAAPLAAGVAVSAIRAYDGRLTDDPDLLASDAGLFGAEHGGEPVRLVMLGDSLAVGVGAGSPELTIGARLAHGLASALARPVELSNFALVGSESKELPGQLEAVVAMPVPPDLAVIIVGGNDVLHRTRIAASVRYLYRAVLDLKALGCKVVVGTCPDLGTVRLAIQPVRYYLRRMSRRLAIAQMLVVLRAGSRPVPLLDTVGPIFWHKPKLMFSPDHFHPSALGYARAAAA